MKKFLLLINILTLSLIAFSQTGTDTTAIKCFPVPVVKMIAKDLLRGDSAMAELNLANKHIKELEFKISLKDSILVSYESILGNQKVIMNNQDKKFKLLEDRNIDLQNKLIREKFKLRRNTWISIGVGVLTSITYLIIR